MMTLKYEVKIVYPSFKGARGDPKSNRKSVEVRLV